MDFHTDDEFKKVHVALYIEDGSSEETSTDILAVMGHHKLGACVVPLEVSEPLIEMFKREGMWGKPFSQWTPQAKEAFHKSGLAEFVKLKG